MYEQGLEVSCTGMANGTPPAPCVVVIYGVAGDLSRTTLRTQIKQVQMADHIPDNVLFHLSVPPSLYAEIVHKLAAASLLQSQSGWRRVMIEKPFGHDEASARALDRELLKVVTVCSVRP